MSDIGREQCVPLAVAISSGTGTGTFTNAWALARWVRIKPVAETDSFDITIKDADGIIMVSRTAQIGTYSERLEISLGIMRTLLLANCTQDGTYQVRLDLH